MTNHSKTIAHTFQIEQGIKVYDFKKCLEFIESQGKIRYGRDFQIHEIDLPTIYKLIVYFIRDENLAFKLQIDLGKGYFIVGTNWMWKNVFYVDFKTIFLPKPRLQNQNLSRSSF